MYDQMMYNQIHPNYMHVPVSVGNGGMPQVAEAPALFPDRMCAWEKKEGGKGAR